MYLHGLRLPSNTGLYDRAGPGASSRPSLPQRMLHDGSGPVPPSAQRAHLAVVAVDVMICAGPPVVQDGRGRARTEAVGPVVNRGPLCARVGHGCAGLSYTAAGLAGNLLTQL